MGLADAGCAEDDDVLAVLNEVAGGQRLEQLLVERGLVGVVETVQALQKGKAGQAGAHGDGLGSLGGELLGEQLVGAYP